MADLKLTFPLRGLRNQIPLSIQFVKHTLGGVFLFFLVLGGNFLVVAEEKYSLTQRPVAKSDAEFDDYTAVSQATATPEKVLPLAEAFLTKYDSSQMRGIVYRDMVSALSRLNQFDKAFEVGAKALAEKSDNLSVMAQLADVASNAALNGNLAFSDQGIKFGRDVIALFENGKRPYEFTEEQWAGVRPKRMAQLYTSVGILLTLKNESDGAVNMLVKALQFEGRDPYTQLMLAKAYKSMLDNLSKGVGKNPAVPKELTGQIQTVREQMMLSYTRALVLSEDPQFSWLHPSVEAEVTYVYQTVPELAKIQSMTLQALTDRVRTEQNAEPSK